MREYIDRHELLRAINENVAEAHNERCSQLLEAILNAPTADVVEVRHGVWIEQIRDYGKYCITEGFECSICGLELMDNDYNYCPECGAKMDGERREE